MYRMLSVDNEVLRGLKFCVRARPAPTKFTPAPHPQEFEKFCLYPHRTLLTRTRPADHPNPRPPRTFSVSNPYLSENYYKLITRASFCCNKIVRNMHLFLTKVAVKVAFTHKHFKPQ